MEWPAAALLIVALAVVLVVALRVLGEVLARRASAKTKGQELRKEAKAAWQEQEKKQQEKKLSECTGVVEATDGESGCGP
jgi:Tfp pilus assembly protein PilX